MNVVIYARVSSVEQVSGYSIDAQIEHCKNWCQSKGYVVSGVYSELGKSAKTDGRPVFQKMISEVLSLSNIGAVVVHKCDRFARNLLDLLRYKKRLFEKNILIFSVSEDFLNGTGPEVDLVVKIMGATAEYVSWNIGNEAKKGIEQKAVSGSYPGSKLPLGYIRVGEKRQSFIKVCPDFGGIIIQAFKDFSTGQYTLDSWSKEAARRGYCNRSGVIGRSSWHLIFRNNFYTGRFSWGGKEYIGNHPALIDFDTWAGVQWLLDNCNSGGVVDSHFWLLSGLLWSVDFARPMNGTIAKGKYKYYRCDSRGVGSEHCVRADVLEEQVIKSLTGITLKSRYISAPDNIVLALLASGNVQAVYNVLMTGQEKRDLLRLVFPKNSLQVSGSRVSVGRLKSGFESV